jgi:hypothetical protein
MDSGLMERAVAIVINVRINKRGIHWKTTKATTVVGLWVQRINANWEAVA